MAPIVLDPPSPPTGASVGFTFDGVHSSVFGLYLAGKVVDLTPAPIQPQQHIQGRPGAVSPPADLGIRSVVCTLAATAVDRPTLIANMEAFSALLDPTKGARDLIFDDRPGRKLSAVLSPSQSGGGSQSGAPAYERQTLYLQTSVQFDAIDPPFWLATTPQSSSWAPAKGASTTLRNRGTADCPLKITIRPKAGTIVTAPGLTIGGVPVGITGALSAAAGDVAVIDTGAMTITVNGVSAVDRWAGTFPKLPKATSPTVPTDVTVVETESSNVGAQFTFDYTERYT